MKIIALALSLTLMTTAAFAKVTIQTDNRVDILAVNQQINDVPKKGKGDLQLENGVNQMLIRVTSMVDGNGGKSKFYSHPMVVVFEAYDETLRFETPFAIRDQRGVDRFNKMPDVKVTSNGKPFVKQTDIIIDKSFALIKDYDEMLDSYNQSDSPIAIAPNNANKSKTERVSQNTHPKVVSSKVNLDLEQAFLDMTPEQRQEFVSWAVKHLNHGL